MTITFTRTAGQLIKGAMQDMRVLGIGETPTSDEYAYGVERLNAMFKGLGAEGITPWTREEATATFAADTDTVTLSPRPVDVLDAGVQVSSTYERVMTRWETGEYDQMPNKGQAGEPLIYVVVHEVDAVKMKVWPVPRASTTIAYRYMRVIDDVADENGTLDVPQTWLEGLQAMLAIRMTAFGTPPQEVAEAAAFHTRRLSDLSRPESYIIEADL